MSGEDWKRSLIFEKIQHKHSLIGIKLQHCLKRGIQPLSTKASIIIYAAADPLNTRGIDVQA